MRATSILLAVLLSAGVAVLTPAPAYAVDCGSTPQLTGLTYDQAVTATDPLRGRFSVFLDVPGGGLPAGADTSLLVVSSWTCSFSYGDGSPGSYHFQLALQATVPSMVGLRVSDARTALMRRGLAIGYAGGTASPPSAPDAWLVRSHSPAAGTTLLVRPGGGGVTLTAEPGVTVPDVRNRSRADAYAILAAAGISGISRIIRGGTGPGVVRSQTPAAATIVLRGSVVLLDVDLSVPPPVTSTPQVTSTPPVTSPPISPSAPPTTAAVTPTPPATPSAVQPTRTPVISPPAEVRRGFAVPDRRPAIAALMGIALLLFLTLLVIAILTRRRPGRTPSRRFPASKDSFQAQAPLGPPAVDVRTRTTIGPPRTATRADPNRSDRTISFVVHRSSGSTILEEISA